MILAGDIGGTNARLALFDVKNGKFNLVSSTVFPSRHYSGLDEIVKEFVDSSGARPALAGSAFARSSTENNSYWHT